MPLAKQATEMTAALWNRVEPERQKKVAALGIRVLACESFPERVTGNGLASSRSRGAAQNGNWIQEANNRRTVSCATEDLIRHHLTSQGLRP